MRLFQITEDDLADLEKTLPDFGQVMMTAMNNRLRVQVRRVQSILTNVRWNYGPPNHVEVIPAEPPPPPDEQPA